MRTAQGSSDAADTAADGPNRYSRGVTVPADSLIGLAARIESAMQLWAHRTQPDTPPQVRRAVNHAVDAIDDLLRTLYHHRATLLSQARAHDTTTARIRHPGR